MRYAAALSFGVCRFVDERSGCILSAMLAAVVLCGCASVPQAKLEAARAALAKKDFRAAFERYSKILERFPNHKEAQEKVPEARAGIIRDSVVKAAESVPAPPTVPALRQAIAMVKSGMATYDPGNAELRAEITKYEDALASIQEKNKQRAGEILDLLSAEKFVDALKTLDGIKSSEPQSSMIDSMHTEIKTQHEVFLEKQYVTQVEKGDFAAAGAVLKEWDELYGITEQTRKFLHGKQHQKVRQMAEAAVARKQYYAAFWIVRDSGLQEALADFVSKIRQEGAPFYLQQANLRKEKGEIPRAYLEVSKGNDLGPKTPGMFEMWRDLTDLTGKQLEKYIAIPKFAAPRDQVDLGAQFSDDLIGRLFRTLPYGVNIAEREKIDMVLEEKKREMKDLGKILRVDMIVIGTVSMLNIDHHRSERNATKRVKVGEKTEINPEYQLLLERVGSRITTMANLPARTVKVPQFETFQYKKGRETIKGYVSVSFRIFDTAKGRLSDAQQLNAKIERADTFQDAVEPANVEEDLLDLPTDTEVAEELRGKVLTDLASIVQNHFAGRESRLLNEAKYHLQRRESVKALDYLAQLLLYAYKARLGIDDTIVREGLDLILQETEKGYLPPPGPAEEGR